MAFTTDLAEKALNAERELQNFKLKNSMLQEFADSLKKQLKDSEDALQKSRHEYYEVLQNKDTLKYELDTISDEIKRLRNHKLELTDMLKRKNNEITTLKETIESIQSIDYNVADNSKNSTINDIKLREIKLNFEETRLNHEKNLYNNQIKLLNEELENKTNELLKCRKESNKNSLQANLKIEQQANDINSLTLEVNRLKKLNESKESANEELAKKVLDLQLNCTKLDSTFSKETEAQNDIINLLMKGNNELKNEIESKCKDIEELRNLLKKGCEAHNELELEFKTMKENYMKDIKELEGEKNLLLQELKQSKDLFTNINKRNVEKEFEKHFPLASETNRQLNNMVKLSDLYDELVRVKKDLAEKEETITQLNEQNEKLIEKIEEDQPVMFKNIQDYESMMKNYAKLETDLFELLMEKDKYMAEKDEDTRTINTLKREVKRYQQENNDLSIQIQYLLKSVQEAKGFIVQQDSSFQNISNISSGFSYELVTFKDIQDLQDKNRQLMSLLHQISEELDSKESANNTENVTTLHNELEECRREVENLKNEINQKNDIIERTTKQKRLIQLQENCEYDPLEILVENKELKQKVEKYVEDIESIRQQSLEEIRRLENDKNDLITDNANIKASLSTVNSQLDAKKQYIENVDLTLEKIQNENLSLRERNIKLNANIENLEKNIINLVDQIDSLKETIKMNDNKLQLTLTERDLYKNNENNFLKENANLKEELENHKKMLYSLKAVQDNFNKIENDSIRSQSVQIENLQKENLYYREKLEKQEDRWKSSLDEFSSRFNNLQSLLDKERHNYLELQREYFELKLKFQQHSEKLPEKELVQNMAPQFSESGPMNGSVKKQLQIAQDEIKVLKGKLNNSETTCNNLKTINVSLEENLNKLIENNSQIKSDLDGQLQSKINIINQLNDDLIKLKSDHDKIIEQKNSEINELKTLNNSNATQIDELKRLLSEAKEATEKALRNECQVLDDLKIQSIIAAKAQEDYESEMALRSEDSKTIFDLKLKLEESQKSLLEKENEAIKIKEQLSLNTDSLTSERKALSEECEKLKIRCQHLEQSNDSLITQIDLLNNQIIALQNNSNIFLLDENNQKENANKLLAVIKFLREEKSQLQSQISKSNDENVCLKVEIENYKREIDNLKKTLEIEKQSLYRLNNMTEFNDLLVKAEMVSVLTENNSQMRNQIVQLEKRCSQLTEKVASFESKEKTLQDLANKAEIEEVNKEFLKSEVENWKTRANLLSQQLKNFDTDSIKRLMSEKAAVSKQVQAQLTELNKVKQELVNKNQELNSCKNQILSVQNVNTQLKALARKYKAEISKIKNSSTESIKTNVETAEKEVQSDNVQPVAATEIANIDFYKQSLVDMESKLKDKLESTEKLMSEIKRITEENESLKKHANEKEEIAKKIAQQAKVRLSDLTIEKNNLIKEKENLVKEIDDLKLKIAELQTSAEQNSQYLSLMRSQYDTKISQHEKDLQVANKHIESLTSKLQQPISLQTQTSVPASTSAQFSNVIPVGIATNITSSTAAAPVRHSVHPQQQPATASTVTTPVVKTTPTASIKPLTVAATRSSSTSSRSGQVLALVLPTANESVEESLIQHSSHVSVPQATVQPTQAQILPGSSTAVSSTIPSTSSQNVIEISEVSTSQNQTNLSLLSGPSTSGMHGNFNEKKRVLDSSDATTIDEPSSSISKRMKMVFAEATTVISEENESDIDICLDDRGDERKQECEDENVILDLEESQEGNAPNVDDDEEEQQVDSALEENQAEEGEIDNDFDNEEGEYDSAEEDEKSYDELVSGEEGYEEIGIEFEDENVGLDDEEEEDEDDIDSVDEEDEGDEENDNVDQIEDSSDIEVIAIDDSDDEQDSNAPGTSGMISGEVSSSHGPSLATSNQGSDQAITSHESNDLTTTTTAANENESNAAQSNQPGFSGSFQFGNRPAQSEESNFQSPDSEDSKQALPSQSTSARPTFSEPSNTSELASSTSNTNRFQRRQPVTWPDNRRNITNQAENRNQSQPPSSSPNASQPLNVRRLNVRGQRNVRRGINRSRRNFRY